MLTVWDAIRNVVHCLLLTNSPEKIMKLVQTKILTYCEQNGTPVDILDMDLRTVGNMQVSKYGRGWIIRIYDNEEYDYLRLIIPNKDL